MPLASVLGIVVVAKTIGAKRRTHITTACTQLRVGDSGALLAPVVPHFAFRARLGLIRRRPGEQGGTLDSRMFKSLS